MDEFKQAKDNVPKLFLNKPRLLNELKIRESEFLPDLRNVAVIVEPLLERISGVFPHYTLHNIEHSIRVMEYMFDLISDIELFSDLEIVILIYVALLHDVGMYISDKDINLIKNNSYKPCEFDFSLIRTMFKNDELAVQECVRRIHAERSGIYIKEEMGKYLRIPSQPATGFVDDVALICMSHAKDIDWLEQNLHVTDEKGTYELNSMYCSVLLRLADILDIDSNRTPPELYLYINPQGKSDEEWKQHFLISNRNKIKYNDETTMKSVVFYGECNDARIHRKILKYMSWVNDEIQHGNELTNSMKKKYHLNLKFPLENKIRPQGYTISDLKLTIDFLAISSLLMGEKLYGQKQLGLREIVQNSIDACNVRKEIEEKENDFAHEEFKKSIKIIIDRDCNELIIKDNGTGMTLDVIKNYFLNVGASFYKSEEFKYKHYNYVPVGNFGIGFLSCFMLSDTVTIKTRYFKNKFRYNIGLEKDSEYITLNEVEDVSFQGTEVILKLDSFMDVFKSDLVIEQFLSEYFLVDDLDFKLINKSDKVVTSIKDEEFNKKITKKEYKLNLSDYLVNVEGYLILENKNNLFGNKLSDIEYKGEEYYYDGYKLEKIDPSTFEIAKLYLDETIRFIEICIVDLESQYDFDRKLEVLNDYEQVFEYEEDNMKWVTIFIKSSIPFFDQYVDDDNDNDYIVSTDPIVINGQSLDLSSEIGHLEKYPINFCPSTKNILLDSDNKNLLFLQYRQHGFMFSSSNQLYLRNILIRAFRFNNFKILSGIKIANFKINVKDKNITPDISRSYLDEESTKILTYAIAKAIHLFILDTFKLSEKQKKLIREFIKLHYSNDNVLLKLEA